MFIKHTECAFLFSYASGIFQKLPHKSVVILQKVPHNIGSVPWLKVFGAYANKFADEFLIAPL